MTNFRNVRYLQYIATLSATLSLTCTGTFTCWPSPTLPKLTSQESPIGTTLSSAEASWVASSFQLGFIPGGILSGWIVSRFGPKRSILIAVIPYCLPWIAIIFARSAYVLYVARFFGGIAGAITATAVPIYNGEVTDKDIRGKLGSMCSLLIIVGNLLVLTLGPFVSYTVLAAVCGCIPLVYGTIFWFMPDSPYYLVKISRQIAARNSIRMLCNRQDNHDELESKMDEITCTINNDMKYKSNFLEFFTKQMYRKQLIILLGLKIIQQFSGLAAIDAYMQLIVKSSGSSISPEHSSIIFGIIQVVSVLVAATFVDKLGRKPLLITSALGFVVSLGLEGLYFYIQDNYGGEVITNNMSWVPTTGIVLYLIMDAVGLGTLPYVLMSEIFPANIKSHAVALNTVLNGSLGCIVILSFMPITNCLGMYATFWLYSTVALLGAIFIYVVLPETKNRTLAEIQTTFSKKNLI